MVFIKGAVAEFNWKSKEVRDVLQLTVNQVFVLWSDSIFEHSNPVFCRGEEEEGGQFTFLQNIDKVFS